jgi:hypothetical protein
MRRLVHFRLNFLLNLIESSPCMDSHELFLPGDHRRRCLLPGRPTAMASEDHLDLVVVSANCKVATGIARQKLQLASGAYRVLDEE